MKVAKLFFNPNAGNGAYEIEELKSLIEKEGYTCYCASTKEKGWDYIEPDVDFVIIAGGDGAVRKVISFLLKDFPEKKYPVALIPLGTANNIGKCLEIEGTPAKLIRSWKSATIKPFDIGKINGGDKKLFFLEGFGFGAFPNLINKMRKKDMEETSAEQELKTAQELLQQLMRDYEARTCKLEIDGVDHSGKFLLVEIMNTSSIGPNLYLNQYADPGDGELEVVLIPEVQREKFADYLQDRIDGKEESFSFSILKAKEIKIQWDGVHIHADDKILKADKSFKGHISILEGAVSFIVKRE